MKRTILTLLLFSLLLTGCSPLDDRMSKEDIFSYVSGNQEMILSCITAKDFSPLSATFPEDRIMVKDDHVDFDCGGKGFGSATAYCGFFWSKEENLRAVWCAPPESEVLSPQGNGYFWKETQGENTYYVEKICDGFFYYESSF